jgi:hypothetical protein
VFRIRWNLIIASSVFGTLILAYKLLNTTTERVYILGREFDYQCWFKKVTGLPCPGCGGTRAFVFALHGDFYHSLQLNPAALVLLAGLIAIGVVQLILAADRFGYCQSIAVTVRKLAEPKYLAMSAYLFVAVALGQWLVKIIAH